MESKFQKDLAYWKDKAEELAEYSSSQLDKYGARENERRVELRENANKAFDALLQQEKISNKWKYELEETVKAYEATLRKLKKENRTLKN